MLSDALAKMMAEETERFIAQHPRTMAHGRAAREHWLQGVPLHWMRDWASPSPIYAERAEGARLWDIDGHVYDDFCLGDTPAMFGHARPEIVRAVSQQSAKGLGYMLPTARSNRVGQYLASRFSLPLWQTAVTATDANRAALRWARAVTGRAVVLVFDGAYHGAVEDAFVAIDPNGRTITKPGLIGQVADLERYSRCIPFNDLSALEAALAPGDVAAVLAEPVMTNCGMILPDPGFHEALRTLTRSAGTLLILDETHTLSSGPGGYSQLHGLAPDILTLGKAIAGGFPSAVWGVTQDMAERMAIAATQAGSGYSGIGTTLSGNALAMAAMEAMLSEVMTPAAYETMLAGAERLRAGLDAVIAQHHRPWCVVSVGARVELVLAHKPPRNAGEVRASLDAPLLKALNLFLINRGLLIAPFHTMMLISPQTDGDQIDRLVAGIAAFLQRLPSALDGGETFPPNPTKKIP